MIRDKVSASQIPMQNDDVEICQRVFDQICAERSIETDIGREKLAMQIIHFYQHGVKDENSLKRLLV
jgi:hypothetical protein